MDKISSDIDVKVKCKVNDKATAKDVITNIAEISKYEDKDKNEITEDRDSQPHNFPDDKKTNDYNGNGEDNGYWKGIQDDDDFEKIIVQQFDLSLRKYIADIRNTVATIDKVTTEGRVPDVDVTKLKSEESTTAEYNHSKKPLITVRGSVVTYTIVVYNEGNIDGYVNEITDYLPEELEFIPTSESETNKKYNWKVSSDGRKVTTDVK